MPGIMGELGEERPLGPAVALPEWVQSVDVGKEIRQLTDKRLARQSP